MYNFWSNSLDEVWFSSDHHFGHRNIIDYADRPFDFISMDNELIARWNAVVRPDDLVFYLGDFTLGDLDEAYYYFRQLNGYINFATLDWHHDSRWIAKRPALFTKTARVTYIESEFLVQVSDVKINGWPIQFHCTHFPLASWNKKHYGFPHLHGHSHGRHLDSNLCIDVGVDAQNFAPVSLRGLINRVREWESS